MLERSGECFAKIVSGPFLLSVVGIWSALLIVVLARSCLKPNANSVYPIFANAAREWKQGADIYDLSSRSGDLDRFRYAPVIAIFFIPFAALPDALGGTLWRLVNITILFAGAIAFARNVFPGSEGKSTLRAVPANYPRPLFLNRKSLTALAALLFPLSLGSINNAQSNTLMVGCLLLGVALVEKNRWNWGAVCLATPVLFKIYPLSVTALLVLVQPRLAWRVGLAVAAGCLLPFAFQDPGVVVHEYGSWINQISHDNRHAMPLENSCRDVHTLTRLVGLEIPDHSYKFIQLAVAALAAGLVLYSKRLGWTKPMQLRGALDLGVCWIILFGPATENCTYALLAPTLAFSAWEAFQGGQPLWRRFWLSATVILFVTAIVITSTPLGKSVSYWLMPIGGLLVFAERLASYWRPQPEPAALLDVPEAMPQAA